MHLTPSFRASTRCIACLLAALLVFEASLGTLSAQAPSSGPSPGRLRTEAGVVSMVCQGTARDGVPTVVFESGLGVAMSTWEGIQPEIAKITRTCAYDRLGVGESDPVPEGRTQTPFGLVETLRGALRAAGEQGPFVLVGHSIAGLILLAYTHRYPKEVAGLVFVDASHPEQWVRFREVNPSANDPTGIAGRERIDRGQSTKELSAVGTFGDLPVAVLYQARPTDSPTRPVWVELQRDHASRSTNSRLIPATESGHFIHIDQPDLVLEAIRWVLELRGGAADEAVPHPSG